jgi:hypothetical protein
MEVLQRFSMHLTGYSGLQSQPPPHHPAKKNPNQKKFFPQKYPFKDIMDPSVENDLPRRHGDIGSRQNSMDT